MATMNSALSKKNEYWLPKERQKELEWYVKQYEQWSRTAWNIKSYAQVNVSEDYISTSDLSDPTVRAAKEREWYLDQIHYINCAVQDAVYEYYYGFSTYLKRAVINGWSYDILRTHYPDLKLNRRDYYVMRRKFFWILDQYLKGLVHEME